MSFVCTFPNKTVCTFYLSNSLCCQFLPLFHAFVVLDKLIFCNLLLESFNIWHPIMIITVLLLNQNTSQFWCRQWLNPRSLIQPSEILLIELTETHLSSVTFFFFSFFFFFWERSSVTLLFSGLHFIFNTLRVGGKGNENIIMYWSNYKTLDNLAFIYDNKLYLNTSTIWHVCSLLFEAYNDKI